MTARRTAALVLVALAATPLFAQRLAPVKLGDYTLLAWNDLGMHCLNPTYDTAVILPPYNNLVAQVVKRGSPPRLVTTGITVEYRIDGNTSSAGKRGFGQFWKNAVKLFGKVFGISSLANDVGLKGKRLSGTMDLVGARFTAEGIPLVPVDDAMKWNPYQVAVVTVKDAAGKVIAETRSTVPTSDEINCAKCHGNNAFQDILAKHDRAVGTSLVSSTPVLCASCHDTPALGTTGGQAGIYLSKAIHGFHAQVSTPPSCVDCHPGTQTKCNRSTRHTAADGNCTSCHGTLAMVANTIGDVGTTSGRVPWVSEPSCVTCHKGVTQVDTGAALYRNSTGHGGVSCAACHGSPHAMVPTNDIGTFKNWDSYQSIQYQGYTSTVKSIGSCGVCHQSSRGQERSIGEFSEIHGSLGPEQPIGCSACHTSIPARTAAWPHAYQWKNSVLR
jgi:nitrate/TMAO reductase-like tetraheme cytochrome c subunit